MTILLQQQMFVRKFLIYSKISCISAYHLCNIFYSQESGLQLRTTRRFFLVLVAIVISITHCV